jgi:hypothetical protein
MHTIRTYSLNGLKLASLDSKQFSRESRKVDGLEQVTAQTQASAKRPVPDFGSPLLEGGLRTEVTLGSLIREAAQLLRVLNGGI